MSVPIHPYPEYIEENPNDTVIERQFHHQIDEATEDPNSRHMAIQIHEQICMKEKIGENTVCDLMDVLVKETAIRNIQPLKILSYVMMVFIISFIIYGTYEFIYNFNITSENAGLIYEIKTSNRDLAIKELNIRFEAHANIYRQLILSVYITYILFLSSLLIAIRLTIHKVYFEGKDTCPSVFVFLCVLLGSSYFVLLIVMISREIPYYDDSRGFNKIIYSTNLMLCGPLDMIIFVFLNIFSFFVPLIIWRLTFCLNFL